MSNQLPSPEGLRILQRLNKLYRIGRGPPKSVAQRTKRIVAFRCKGLKPPKTFNLKLKAAAVGDGRLLTGVASSDALDRDGDVMSPAFLQRMAKDIVQVPVFADHHYSVVNDVVGKVISAQLLQRDGFNDLNVGIELLPEGDAVADRVWSVVKAGVPIGLSIGAIISDYEPIQKGQPGIRMLDGEIVDLSIVGIPSQPRSQRLQPVS